MIGFRVDANEVIATGHMMRCIAIAMECMKRGEECLFFLAEDKETERLKDRGIPFRVLHTDWQNMEGEQEQLVQLLQKEKVDWLIVDSYQVTLSYLSYLEQYVSVLYIDDIEAECYPVSAVLRYSLWPEDRHYLDMYREKSSRTSILAGMQYVPLREEFGISWTNDDREKSILITTGGTDTYNIAARLLRACIRRKELAEYSFHVIVGSLNQHEEELRQIEQSVPRVFLHKNISNMSDYMRQCELAVSAGGSTLFELCACKIPTVCFSFADNQSGFAAELEERKIMVYAGDARTEEGLVEKITDSLYRFSVNPELKEEYAGRMGKLVDGKGTKRIADFLLGEC